MPPQFDLNEEETRAELIDPALAQALWGNHLTPKSRIRREYYFTQGKLLGAASAGSLTRPITSSPTRTSNSPSSEAKRVGLHETEGVGQAKRYAERLNIRFAYATNGKKIWRIDRHRAGKVMSSATQPRKNSGRPPTPSPATGASCSPPSRFEDKSGTWQARYYRHNAISHLEAIISGKRPHPADPGDRHRQNCNSLPDCLEAVS
ncbi:MAG: hypothetical protein R3E89_03240 [Thiolinea sp.]